MLLNLPIDSEKYGVIMKVVWDIINSQGSSWKQVFKVLTLDVVLFVHCFMLVLYLAWHRPYHSLSFL